MQAASQAPPLKLPDLRQDLRLFSAAHDARGAAWLIYDPPKHRYYQISEDAFQLLKIWQPQSAEDFSRRASKELGRPVNADELGELITFLASNNLTLDPPDGDARSYARQEARSQQSLMMRLVHGYLFFKIPLLRPNRILEATLPFVAPLYTRTALYLLLAITAIGVYLTSRQWDVFVTTFLDFLTLDGALFYGISLVLIKSLHELGHAYTATRYGVRVNTMGIAMMVMMPMLYTEVTDAWRLQKRRQKLAIDAAGIFVELAVAGISTFLWAFLPDGPLRSVAFLFATTSWIMSLAINLNPLMRFDGYYIVADAWGIPNLQPRSNALARWWLREALFGLRHPAPEAFPRRTHFALLVYAFAIWIYRLFLFVGIALVVYHMFFKVLGVVLFAIEIGWFVALPVWRELKEWWHMRSEILHSRRGRVTLGLACAALIAVFIPWSGTLTMQAIATAPQETRIFAPRPAQVERVALKEGLAVEPGAILAVLHAPELDYELAQTRLQIQLSHERLNRIAGDDTDRSNAAVLQRELASAQEKLSGLQDEQDRLVLKAPHTGVVRDADIFMQPGEWIDDATSITRVVSGVGAEVKGYLHDDEVWRATPGSNVTFIPEDPLQPKRQGKLVEIAQTGSRNLELLYLSSVYGGAVPSDRNSEGEIRPRTGRYLVRAELDGPPLSRTERGTLHVAGKPESFAAAAWRRILQVLVRESGA